MRFILELPYPPSELSPNSRIFWSAKARAVKTYRTLCAYHAKNSGLANRIDLTQEKIELCIEFFKPDRRKRDDDNIIASFKAGRDGVADALGIDDNRFKVSYSVSDEVSCGGKVKLTFFNKEH